MALLCCLPVPPWTMEGKIWVPPPMSRDGTLTLVTLQDAAPPWQWP